MDLLSMISLGGGLINLVVGQPTKVNYAVRDAIVEVEATVGRKLPEAWDYWERYKQYIEWGNSMFFSWDKQAKWRTAQQAVKDLSEYLKQAIIEYEEARKVAVVAPTWQKYLPLAVIGAILFLSYKKEK